VLCLSVIVPATNAPPTLRDCKAALEPLLEPGDELLVVDDPPGAGPAEARNAGAALASGDVLVFVDADVVVHADALDRIRQAFAGDPELVGIFGCYDDRPAAPGMVSCFRNLLHHHVHASSPGRASTFWAGLGALRRDAFLESGGFDAKRYALPSIEDVELGARLAARGARLELDPLLQGTHLKSWTLHDMVRTDVLRRGAPWVELLLQGGIRSDALNTGPRHRASALLALGGVLALLRGKRGAAALALGLLVALNRDFYGLLVRRRGPLEASAGVALHALHHLSGIAAVPLGVAWRVTRGSSDAHGVPLERRPGHR
jgi:hypothetical protein